MKTLKQSRGPSRSVAAIINHPVRARCWDALAERTLSPKELADELRMPLSDVSYHVRILRDLGVIELVETQPVRGALRHRYKAVERPHLTRHDIEEMAPEEVVADATRISQLGFADLSSSLDSGKIAERPEHAAVRYPMDLDEEGWRKAADAYETLLDTLFEAQAESDERRGPDSPSVKTIALGFLFEKPTD
ncbi:MAG TPA: winged helix-turn-helix domain-containing protein [Solirubrobacterales bacterium]|jgi:DNA-binding transcriptional ArsR family regulator